MIRSGDIVALQHNGHYLGGVMGERQAPMLRQHFGNWERFLIETHQNHYSFKQVVSGLYLGGDVRQGERILLVSERKNWEMFSIESVGNLVCIKTDQGTYLTANGDRVFCTANRNGKDLWTIQLIESGNTNNQNTPGNKETQGGGLPDISRVRFPREGDIPHPGDIFYFHRGGMFVGVHRDMNKGMSLSHAPLGHEKWKLEKVGDKYSFRQQVSGYYLGYIVKEDHAPQLIDRREKYETFMIEQKDGGLAIRSCDGTYLTQDGTELKWKKHPQHGLQIFKIFYDENKYDNDRLGFNLGSTVNISQSKHKLPAYGQPFSFGQYGRHVGGVMSAEMEMTLCDHCKDGQVFFLEYNNNRKKVMIKQKSTGLKLGGSVQHGHHAILTNNQGDWENFTIENRGNGHFSIKSCLNTYLCTDNNRLVWKEHLDIGRDIWKLNLQ